VPIIKIVLFEEKIYSEFFIVFIEISQTPCHHSISKETEVSLLTHSFLD
jgi:hypothetical protein